MAGDWIKMRVWLRRDPRVASIADFLATDRRFMDFITDPVRRTCDATVYEHITRDVTRAITVTALLEVWGVARERGHRDGDDLVLKHCDLGHLDDICSIPGFGEAMEYVDWAILEERIDKRGRSVPSVRLPEFFKESTSPEDRYKQQHAAAQARYRAKQKGESDEKRDATSDVTGDITVTPREEKRREEETPPNPRKRGKVHGFPPGFETFWAQYPKKAARAEAAKAFARVQADEALLRRIVAALEVQKQSPQWLKDGGQYVPNGATWLNGRRWEDELTGVQAAPKAWEGAQ